MFELTKKEFEDWRSQFVISKSDKMGLRYRPMAFTEQGVTMLSFDLLPPTSDLCLMPPTSSEALLQPPTA